MLLSTLLVSALLQAPPTLERVTVVPTAAPRTEIVSIQAATARAVVTHADAKGKQLELFDLADPARPRSVRTYALSLADGEELTSVAFHPSADWFVAVVRANGVFAPGRALLIAAGDGRELARLPTGVGPDSVVISSDGKRILIADEAEEFEGRGRERLSAPGGVTLIELDPADLSLARATHLTFSKQTPLPTDGRTIERDVDDEPDDLELLDDPTHYEPEHVLFLPDGQRALVTLQESNAVATLTLDPLRLERLLPLGNTSHAADLKNDGRFQETGTLLGRREPDGIALTPDGRHFLTADEGDTDPNVDKTPAGKPVGGGRTLSIFEVATGAFVADTGPELDRAAARAGLYPDARSTKKGCEPEMVLVFERAGRTLAAVTLERAGALALVDVTAPERPTVLALQPSGAKPTQDAPEGLAHLRDRTGEADYLYVANEGTGTLGVLRVR